MALSTLEFDYLKDKKHFKLENNLSTDKQTLGKYVETHNSQHYPRVVANSE